MWKDFYSGNRILQRLRCWHVWSEQSVPYQDRTDSKLVFLPINNMDKVMLSDLVGYEIQKKNWWTIPGLLWKAKSKQCTAFW